MDAHKVVDYIKEHFNQSDATIIVLLAQGAAAMKLIHQQMMEVGIAGIPGFDDDLLQRLEKIDAYLSDLVEEELM